MVGIAVYWKKVSKKFRGKLTFTEYQRLEFGENQLLNEGQELELRGKQPLNEGNELEF